MPTSEPSETLRRHDEHPHAVTTTDLWKCLALALILVDHIGHYLLPDWDILRVIGRLSLPVWFFFIGFARTRDVPLLWLVYGAVLSGVDVVWEGAFSKAQIDILISFALYRLALPVIEQHVLPSPWRLAAFVVILLALMPATGLVIEYGTGGWLLALAGTLHRRNQETQTRAVWLQRLVIAGVAGIAFVIVEADDYGLSQAMSVLLAMGVAVISLALLWFERVPSRWQPGGAIRVILRFCGRHSLEIYVAQIIGLASIAMLWSSLYS